GPVRTYIEIHDVVVAQALDRIDSQPNHRELFCELVRFDCDVPKFPQPVVTDLHLILKPFSSLLKIQPTTSPILMSSQRYASIVMAAEPWRGIVLADLNLVLNLAFPCLLFFARLSIHP